MVIVDNDREKSAEVVALAFRDKLPLTYLVEPVRGIARCRNRAVAASRSPFLAFIDDDEWATPQWLAALERESERSAADAVIGRVEVVFDPEVPELVRQCGLFDPSPLPDGAVVPWYMTRTNNAYVRRDALPDRDAPFSTRFDLIGGEDVHLFKSMIELGGARRRFCNCGCLRTSIRRASEFALDSSSRIAQRRNRRRTRLERNVAHNARTTRSQVRIRGRARIDPGRHRLEPRSC